MTILSFSYPADEGAPISLYEPRHSPSHPMHGLYTGLVQLSPTTEDSMSEFVFLSTRYAKIAIRKSSVLAFYTSGTGETVVEYTSEGVVVKESFDEVCAIMGVTVTPSQQEES